MFNHTPQIFAIRLEPNADLKKSLLTFAKTHRLSAAYVITCVGSVKQAHLRLANQPKGQFWVKKMEILSLVGTFNTEGGHFHVSLADETGATIGGHLLDDNLIFTTAEIVIGNAANLIFKREIDPKTGFKELFIEEV